MDERTAMVTIGGVEYEMLLTTRATKQIAGRYGGLENLGEKLMKRKDTPHYHYGGEEFFVNRF